jgi:hypothetical protein
LRINPLVVGIVVIVLAMCRPATCRTCNKAAGKGCGQHVEQAGYS